MNRGDHWQHFKQHFIEGRREEGRERERRERVDQKAEKTTSINAKPSAQTKSQLKQQQMDNFHLCSGQSHLLPLYRRGSFKQKETEDEGRAGVERRAVRVTDGCGSASSVPQRDRDLRNSGLEDEAPDSRHVLSHCRDALGEQRGQDGNCTSRSPYTP